ncbi:ABC transporter substrate-binding protein [Actibacterium sp. 188UL27-1]|uniref:ABC transporter substrate-binding protein n=1 Tax=Actibacterium sp. 188UL27-1 TaxID=2786961 RepID=UPI001956A1F3|nr:ABC transporter substrate-binding protein [Actibacterium sp. 188UL27-1]MBM7066412.1 ABC transporter substrate-binding protein [Actibacterium sp. 188UL27-1]
MRKTIIALALWGATAASAEIDIPINYLHQIVPQPPTLSNLDPRPEQLGIDGASLGLADNLTTGGFLGHKYVLTVTEVAPDDDVIAAARTALASSPYLLIDAPADTLTTIADLPEAEGALLFNTASADDALRDDACRANLLHTLPSYAMRTDALMQALQKRRWTDLALIEGTHPTDRAFAAALTTSAEKFGLTLGSRKEWVFDADMRRNAAQEVPLFTQDLRDHDVLLIADELHDFGRYIPYNTWEPRPIAGSEGLVPVAWSRVVEQWGAAQLQSRFTDLADRPMQSQDYAAWAAIRTIGEAVTRTNTADPATLRDFILGDDFELGGFKGRPLSYRTWNGQLRQPIPLVHASALAAQAPLDGFLHQRTELDTLGLDQPESSCTAF